MKKYTPAMDDNPDTPLILGTALRVPSYAYENWGIPIGDFREESDAAYAIEWKKGGDNQMDNVILALKTAGMDNYSQELRDANTKFVKAYMKRNPGKVNYLEVGFGVSTEQMFDALDENDKDRIIITGVEPSEDRAKGSAEKLVEMGMTQGKNLHVYVGVDKNIITEKYAQPNSQNIVANVAAFHHHAYLDTPMEAIYSTLANKGIFISSDWHNSMWEHPNRVFEFLKTLEWEGKEDDLIDFAYMFPLAVQKAPGLNRCDGAANVDIMRFWEGWIKARAEAIEEGKFEPGDDILMLEAHRPVGKYVSTIHESGLSIAPPDIMRMYTDLNFDRNPHFHLEGNSLLATLAGQKLK